LFFSKLLAKLIELCLLISLALGTSFIVVKKNLGSIFSFFLDVDDDVDTDVSE
jgi:hypothetical protein